MNARELFKLNGFEVTLDNETKLMYELPVGVYQTIDCIIFHKKEKSYELQIDHAYANVDMKLQQTINKQIEELGWLEKHV